MTSEFASCLFYACIIYTHFGAEKKMDIALDWTLIE